MNTAPEALYCTPEPRLATGEAAPAALVETFAQSEAAGLLPLATVALKDELAPPLAWAREWGRRFVARLCQTRNPDTVELPEPETRAAFLAEAPPLRGAEYLSDA